MQILDDGKYAIDIIYQWDTFWKMLNYFLLEETDLTMQNIYKCLQILIWPEYVYLGHLVILNNLKTAIVCVNSVLNCKYPVAKIVCIFIFLLCLRCVDLWITLFPKTTLESSLSNCKGSIWTLWLRCKLVSYKLISSCSKMMRHDEATENVLPCWVRKRQICERRCEKTIWHE